MLGALQVSSPDPLTSPWYLYEDTNTGVATGFFANANHMAILLVITLPFLAAILASTGGRDRDVQRYSAVVALAAGAGLVVAVGIALNGSLAGYGLAIPVLMASAIIVLPGRYRAIRWLAPLAGVLLIGAVGWLATTPLSSRTSLERNATTSVSSRHEILTTSMAATKEFMPLGSGIGTFRRIYALYENHDTLDPTTYVNHAHNDYLEIALETGVPGLVVVLLFLLWWARAAWRAWRPGDADPLPAPRRSRRPRSCSTAWSTFRCEPRRSTPALRSAWCCWSGNGPRPRPKVGPVVAAPCRGQNSATDPQVTTLLEQLRHAVTGG